MTTHDTTAQPPARGAREPVVVHHLPGGLRSTLEAVLMVVDEPVSVADLAAAFGVGESEVRANLEGLEVEFRDGKVVEFKEYMDTERVTDILCGGQKRPA